MLKLIVDFGTMLIGVEGARLCGITVQRRPRSRLSDEEAPRTAWSGNQQASLTALVGKISIL